MEKNMNKKRIRPDECYNNGTSHTRDERNAYRAMPELMKMRVKRNPMIWYGTIKNYFPDLLFEDCKVVIEIYAVCSGILKPWITKIRYRRRIEKYSSLILAP